MTTTPTTSLTALSWGDLEQWVGSTILERGKSYQHYVHDLAVTEESHLIAIVTGSEDYITHVWLHDGEPDCECSCPYWGPCKHAVAVILAYLDCIKSKTAVQLIKLDELDARLSAYSMVDEQGSGADIDLEKTRTALKAMTKAQLIKWAIEAVSDHPSLFDTLPCSHPTADVLPDKTVIRLRERIRKTASERGWQNHWDNRGYTPDYSPIQKQLEKLLSDGYIEAVLELGEELFSLGVTQVEESDDEGETASEISRCLTVVFTAMSKSQTPAAERMIWFWDKLLNDDYGLLDGIKSPVNDKQMHRIDWYKVAEEFHNRLADCPKPQSDSAWSSGKYHRQRLLTYTVRALSEAGEGEQALELMISELPYSENYIELVDHLLAIKTYDRAEHWAYQGFNKTIDTSPGIASRLVERLIDIATKQKNWHQVAALRVDIFLRTPNVDNYDLAGKASRKAGFWPQVQTQLLSFLETGVSPRSTTDWPLPDTMLKFPKLKSWDSFPDYDQLVAIALHEKRIEDALGWFQKAPDKSFHAEAIAEAVKNTHPDVSLSVWQGKAENLIAKVKPAAYREAMPYLLNIKKLKQNLGQSDDYHQYILALRSQHKAKRRLMEELDTLDRKGKKNRRILDDMKS